MVLSMIYKELYQQVGRSSNNGNEFPGIALILSGKEKHYHVKQTHRSQEDCRLMLTSYELCMDKLNPCSICSQNR